MQVARPSCRRALALVVSPTRNASPFGRSHAVTIAFADPERAREADADSLARFYGLTAREAAVAALLVGTKDEHWAWTVATASLAERVLSAGAPGREIRT
jgi:hypothetical protein